MKKYFKNFIIFFTLIFFSVAHAKDIKNGFTFNPKQPLEITADSLTVDNAAQTAVFEGTVNAIQDNYSLRSNSLKIKYDTGGDSKSSETDLTSGNLKELYAEGNVTIHSGEETAKAQWAKYTVTSDIFELGGNVSLVKGKNILNGDHLIFDLKKQTTKIFSKKGSSRRVRTLITIPEKK